MRVDGGGAKLDDSQKAWAFSKLFSQQLTGKGGGFIDTGMRRPEEDDFNHFFFHFVDGKKLPKILTLASSVREGPLGLDLWCCLFVCVFVYVYVCCHGVMRCLCVCLCWPV